MDVRGLVWMCCGCERVGVDVRRLVWMCCGCERVGMDVMWVMLIDVEILVRR